MVLWGPVKGVGRMFRLLQAPFLFKRHCGIIPLPAAHFGRRKNF